MDIQISNLTKNWKSKTLFDSINVDISKHQITSLIGPNGCGKTTLFNLISGQDLNFSGEIKFDEFDLKKFRNQIRYRISLVLDFDNLDLNLTGKEFVNFVIGMYKNENISISNIQSKIVKLSEIFDMTSSLDQSILNYSHGMIKKIQLIAYLSCPFEILIMDEPFNGLDSESSISLQKILLGLQKKTILISSHNLEIVQKISDKIIILHNTKIKFSGKPEELSKLYNERDLNDSWLEVLGIENKLNKINELLEII